MKRANRILLAGICAISCLLGAAHWFHTKPVHAQQQTGIYDDGTFYITASIDIDSNYNLTTDSYMEVEFDDYEDIDEIEVDGYADQDGGLLISGYSDGDDYDPADVEFYSNAPVATGHEYGIESDGYACFDDGEGDEDCEPVGYTYASVNVAAPPATITGISPSDWTAGQSYQAVQITGTNFGSTPSVTLSDSAIQITRQAYNTSTSSGTSTTYIDISVPSDTPSEPVTVTMAPGANGSSFTSGSGGSLSGSSTADVIGAQQNACPSDTDATSGFSSISPSGLAIGGSGSMAVSFSRGSFNGFGVTVPYGPYSTPESIAAHLAAMITKQYSSSGLTAQAYGANILYKGNATLGNANFTSSGSSSDSSFTADPSPQSCPAISIHLRLVPVASQNEQVPKIGNIILHNVWRLVTLDGKIPAATNYTISEHTSIRRGNYNDTVYPGWYTSSGYPNIFNDGLGCVFTSIPVLAPCDSTTFMQKFTISLPGTPPVAVWTVIPNQGARSVMTIHDHGTAAPTMNNDNGPIYPVYSPNPYNDPIPYPVYCDGTGIC
jgi:hypothetical protein